MPPSKNRQRALARAKMERQIARRAAAARRRRQLQGGIGAGLVVILVAAGLIWTNGGFSHLFSGKKKKTTEASACAWTPQPASGNTNVKDVGTPPTTGIPTNGLATMTITTNQGVIEAHLDASKAACTVESFVYLAGKQFFNNTKCHRLTTQGIYVLQCGDPSATGTGGPAYKFPDENVPEAPAPDPSASPGAAGPNTNLYPAGTLAMANSGADTNGSQFFIVYKDGSQLEAKYTIFGTVTKGLDIVQKIAQTGVADQNGSPVTDGAPKTDVLIQSLTVSAPVPVASGASAPASGQPSATPSNPNS